VTAKNPSPASYSNDLIPCFPLFALQNQKQDSSLAMQVKHRSCFKCKYEIETADSKCNQCGQRLRSRTEIRALGSLLIVLSSFLIGVMTMISSWMYNVIYSPQTANGSRFNGDEKDLAMIAGVFAFVFLFSFTALAAGLWQVIFGRRNMILVWTIIGLGIVFIAGGWAIRFLHN
jgi:hypothetical protein